MRKTSLIFLGAAAGVAVTLATTQPRFLLEGARAQAAAAESIVSSACSATCLNGCVPIMSRNPTTESSSSLRSMACLPGSIRIRVTWIPRVPRMQVETRRRVRRPRNRITMEEGRIKVVAPIDETPAAKAGIMANDIITHLDEEPVQGLTLNQAVEKMRGPVNTKIKLKIMRKGQDKPVGGIEHGEIIRVRSVRSLLEGEDVGFIRITQFNEQTADGLKKAITDLSTESGGKLKGFVVDLRNNPGGLLDQAISSPTRSSREGEIVSTRGRNAEETQRFNARAGDLTKRKPLIVLINGGSASASEIVAGALQSPARDGHRYTFVRQGIGADHHPAGFREWALRLTTARYFTPSGRSIQAKGISPDIEVLQEVPEELKPVTDTRGEASLRGHLKAEGDEQTGSQSYIPPDFKGR